METAQVRHNPGVFKQTNKTHKTGRHRSKGEVLKTNKGCLLFLYSLIIFSSFFGIYKLIQVKLASKCLVVRKRTTSTRMREKIVFFK